MVVQNKVEEFITPCMCHTCKG